MRIRDACSQTQIAVILAFGLFATSAYGQTAESGPGTLESQVERVKAENVALREQLLKIEEQQKELLELIRLSQPTNPTPPDGASSGSAGQRRLCHRQSPRRLRPRKQLVPQNRQRTIVIEMEW